MKKICVFCSASNGIDEKYFNDAKELGILLAKEGYELIYGGSSLGLMGCVSKYAKENGATTTGIMPEKLFNMLQHEGNCHNFYVTKGMRERKAKLDELSNGVIALAGGFGTLEEISEIIVQKILGYNSKPIIFLNTDGFYNTLLKFFDEIIDKKFAKETTKDIYFVADTPKAAIQYLKNYIPNTKEKRVEDIYVSK